MSVKISCNFDGGAIQIVKADRFDDIQVKIRPDNASEFAQWFYFRVHEAKGQELSLRFVDLSKTAYPKGWKDYQVVASYNRREWFRVPTRFEGDSMQVQMTAEADEVYFAYFEPYSYERHLDLVAWANESPLVSVKLLGHTIDGRDMSLLVINDDNAGDAKNKRKVWMIARQHPGETMAEWFVEGFLERLLDGNDAIARSLLKQATIYVVPHMNPDGAVRGNLRTNASGANLNREWLEASIEKSPEVFYVREAMKTIGVDMALDVHGDEDLPYNFLAGCEGVPSYDERHAALEKQFKEAWRVASPEFQDVYGYDKDQPGQANLSMATTWIGEQFKCLSYTVEMPFKDNANLPDAEFGWSSERSLQFGASVAQPILHVLPYLR